MGSTYSHRKVNFEDVQKIITNSQFLLINTLPDEEQKCLIKNSIPSYNEENIINHIRNKRDITIIVYGKNCCDEKIIQKYNQLIKHGFPNVYIYLFYSY